MMFTINIDAETFRDASKLSQERCLESLEEVLAAYAHCMAECYRRPGSWEAACVEEWIGSHYGPVESYRENAPEEENIFDRMVRERQEAAQNRRRACELRQRLRGAESSYGASRKGGEA